MSQPEKFDADLKELIAACRRVPGTLIASANIIEYIHGDDDEECQDARDMAERLKEALKPFKELMK